MNDDGTASSEQANVTECSSDAGCQQRPTTIAAPSGGVAQGRLGFVSNLRLGWSRTCHSMAQALGLKALQDYLQGASSELSPDSPVTLLGVRYDPQPQDGDGQNGPEARHAEALADFRSRLWMTYRREFEPIGETGLTSDVGWGCTLRSGQMLLAEALLRHTMGRSWRVDSPNGRSPEIGKLLRLLHDSPAAQSPFSVHNLCSAEGVSGVRAGEWLGPWVLCHALQSAVNAARPHGVSCHVLAQPGGGAPTLHPTSLQAEYFPAAAGSEGGDAAATADDAAKASAAPTSALIVLLPLTLGIGKVNPRYVPQLKAVLTWPHSIGIVGGRPGSSLYFVGFQGDNVLFLDPHEPQQVVADADVGATYTYHCSTPRLMPLASIDPSLAIGFYCRSAEAFEGLCSQLADLEVSSAGAPLVSIAEGDAHAQWQQNDQCDMPPGDADGSPAGNGDGSAQELGSEKGEDWEML